MAFSNTFWPGKATTSDGGDDVNEHDNAQSHPDCQLHVLPPTQNLGSDLDLGKHKPNWHILLKQLNSSMSQT